MLTAASLTFVRSMRRSDLGRVVLNGVIGAGIFGLASKVFAVSGSYSLIAFSWSAHSASLRSH